MRNNIHETDKLPLVITAKREPIKDFDRLGYPDRTLVDYEKYHRQIGIAMARHTVSLQATRGCPFNCAFCHKIWPKTHITRSANHILQEILACCDAGVRRFVFIDDIFNLDKRNSVLLLESIIKQGLGLQLFFPNGLRGDILTTDFIDLMAEAGTVNIDLALETASPRLQKLIGKNLNLETFEKNVHYITTKYPHILLEMELMTGFPSETREEALETLDFLEHIKWVHFPNLNILKIYPNTDMYRLARENGISEAAIQRSTNLAYHQLPETLPFDKSFVTQYQARFIREYFLAEERLKKLIPLQLQTLTPGELVQKYNSYLPMEIKSIRDILVLAEMDEKDLEHVEFLPEDYMAAPGFREKMQKYFPIKEKDPDALRILLLDLSMSFAATSEKMLYDMVDEPLGLMYLLSYLNQEFSSRVQGKIAKARVDFNSFEELKTLVTGFKPDVIGLRTLSLYKEFFHQAVSHLRQWDSKVPIIAGGPYATSDYPAMLQDRHIDVAVLGEGELTLAQLVETILENHKKLPPQERLKEMPGIAFIPREHDEKKIITEEPLCTFDSSKKQIIEIFEEQAEKFSQKTAIETIDRTLTYQELNRCAHRAAWQIIKNDEGSSRGSQWRVAALLFEHGADMIIGLLGALKAGYIYVPLEVTHPVNRLVNMLEHSESRVIITNHKNAELAETLAARIERNLRIVIIDAPPAPDDPAPGAYDSKIKRHRRSQETLHHLPGNKPAYILYTSGSTGKPKGVLQGQENVLYFAASWTKQFSITSSDRMTLFSSFSHDGSIPDIFASLLNGATLYPCNVKQDIDILELPQWLINKRITIWHSVPTLYRYFIDTLPHRPGTNFPDLRFIVLGGEAVREHDIETFKKLFPHTTLANIYGQSESTVNSFWMVQPGESFDRVLLGKPIEKTELLIIDENGGILEDFGVGEIFIASPHTALEYWRDPKATQQAFLHDPELGRLYRTGDLARLVAPGTIEFLGRKDSQVKIRGFRVELEEIETALLKYEAIKETLVEIKYINPDEAFLCAYIVADSDLDISELRGYLYRELPDYMVPSRFVTLDRMPLTPSGKIDRKALPDPGSAAGDFIAPRDEIEKKLTAIWAGVLGMDQNSISTDANYFELGGHSLKATLMVSKIHKELDIEVPVAQIFRSPTIRSLAQYIEKNTRAPYTSLQPVEKKDYYVVSSPQKRIFILHQLEPHGTTYNLPTVSRINGQLDAQQLTRTFRELIQRHESLRTSFVMIDEKPVQRVHDEVRFEMEYHDLAARNAKDSRETIESFIRPFDLSQAPLLRLIVIKTAKKEQILITDMHHIISDATSMGIMENEFMSLYEENRLPTLRLQYKDYAEWQNRPGVKEKEKYQKQETYWLKQFEGEIPVLTLPTDYPRPAVQDFQGNSISFAVNNEETRALSTLALDQEATMYMVLLSIYNILFYKLSGQEDIVIGTPIMGRRHTDVHAIIGMFVNTLALHNYPQKQKTFEQLLQEVRKNTLAAFENQDYPFENLVEKLDVHRDMSRNPLFDIMFEVQNVERYGVEIPGLQSLPFEFEYWISKFDIVIQSVETGNQQVFIARYKTRLFKKETIERFIGYFKRLISTVLHQPRVRLADLDILSPEEKQQLLLDFNDTAADYPREKTIHNLFREQAEKTPDHVALVGEEDGGKERKGEGKKENASAPVYLSYKELDKKVNRLAGLLIEKGVKADTIVGMMLERSIDMIIGILGTLKAGGAYMPIDPAAPGERTDFMLKDSGAKILLTADAINRVPTPQRLSFHPSTLPPFFPFNPSNLAYIIYTSGSTGKPRGVLVGQRSLVNAAIWHASYYNITQGDHVTQLAAPGFDASVLEIFPALSRGAVLHIIAEHLKTDPWKLNRYYETRGITIGFLPTPLCEQFMELENTSLRTLLTAGDKLRKFIKRNYRLYNNYGPTENTVAATVFPVDKEYPNIPIGKPVYNNRIYILSIDLHLQPIGVIGEICISGDSLALGYLNNPGLTAEKFNHDLRDFQDNQDEYHRSDRSHQSYINIKVPCNHTDMQLQPLHSHRSTTRHSPLTIYRTGDLGRWLADGNIEFSGRIDRQVKVRGYRIEPGEIENRLIEINGISEAAVIDKKDQNGSTYLCAYIISQAGIDTADIRGYLSKKMPEYMVPVYFVRVNTFPLTSSGKIDRRSLPEPGDLPLSSGIDYFPPRDPVEKKLVEIWQRALGRTDIGIHDDFFMLGGDSIKGIQVVSWMRKEGYKIEMKDFLQQPTIAQLSPVVKKPRHIPEQSLITGPVPLTPVQHWLFTESSTLPHHFNQAVLLDWQENLEEEAVRAVFAKILEHHDALRMSYQFKNHRIIQTKRGLVHPVSIQVYDLRQRADALSFLENRANELQAGMHLERGWLMKLGLFRLDDGHRLLIIIHHLVVDGVSWRILFEDLRHLFQQYKKGEPLTLPPKTDSFKYWSEKLQEYANSDTFLKEKAYWLELETRAAAVPTIKKDFPAEDNYLKDAETLSFQLNHQQTHKLLTRVNQGFGTKIDDILLTALGLAVKKTWGIHRLLVDLEGHGREDILPGLDISRTVGWFTSIYPVLLDISYDTDIARQIKEIKETLHRVPHKGIGYGILKYLTAAKHKKDLVFNLEPHINFNYLGQFQLADDVKQGPFRAAGEPAGKTQSPERKRKHEINISGIISDNRLVISITFNHRQFKRETITALCNHYQTRLADLISFCASRETRSLTPADLTYRDLSIETLDRLTSQYALEDLYPLTPMQEGMRFHAVVNRDSTAYFEQISYRLQGKLHIPLVEKSLHQLFKRHDVLRTAFIDIEDSDRTLQMVLKHRPIDFLYEDIRKIEPLKEREKYVQEFKENDRKRSFDLSKDVLMRAAIFRTAENAYEITWSLHHILMDGWCIGILNSEFFEIYTSLLENREIRLPEAKPFRTYVQWLEHLDRESSKNYWTNYLDSFETSTGLPSPDLDQTPKNEKQFQIHRYYFTIDQEKTRTLYQLAEKHGVTLNIVVQTVWGMILGKYNNSHDVVFGAVVSGRPPELPGVETMVGLFINTIPVRLTFAAKMEFIDLLRVVRQKAAATEPHHYYPLVEIQSVSSLKQNLMDHLLVFENYPTAESLEGILKNDTSQKDTGKSSQNPGLTLTNVEAFEHTIYDFSIIAAPGQQLHFRFDYNPAVYNRDFMEQIAGHVAAVIDQITRNETIFIEEISFLTAAEKHRLLYEFNDTTGEHPGNKTIHRLFLEQTEQHPDHIALVGKEAGWQREGIEGKSKEESYQPILNTHSRMQLSYSELNEKSHRLAYLLRKKGIDTGTIVGVMLERSLEMIIGILAVLKAGGAYLPLDPEYPEARKTYMIKDSAINLLLARHHDEIDVIDPGDKTIYRENTGNFQHTDNSANPLYLIYTSGSTGKPKGVMLEHRSLVNLLLYQFRLTNLDMSCILQFTTISFDVSFQEIFSALLAGGKLCLIDKDIRTDIPRLLRVIEKNRVKTLFLPMSMLRVIFDQGEYLHLFPSCVDHIVTAGEQVVVSDVLRNYLQQHRIYLHNHYGPAEAHVVTMLTLDPAGDIPTLPSIGKPVANTRIYILDSSGNLQPVGVPGELCIGGIQPGRGYLNHPELTAGKFDRYIGDAREGDHKSHQSSRSNHPYRSSIPKRIYKTGDQARWLPEGNIQFLGRIDTQVKIRGFRVETGEIENQLLKHDSIREAVVLAKQEENGDKYLCAYIVPQNPGRYDQPAAFTAGLKEYLSRRLPHYMVPAYFFTLEKLPLTPSGKLDRKALVNEKVSPPGLSLNFAAPTTGMERLVAEAWKEVLKLETIGIEDNFFEIGGNSINILKVHSKINKALEMETPVVKMFKYTTIGSLARYLHQEKLGISAGKDRSEESSASSPYKKDQKVTGNEIAVIGMAGVFPGAKDLNEFWENLKNGVESIYFFANEELAAIGFDPKKLQDPTFVKAKGMIPGAEYFDSSFFGYTPKEAEIMDPQVRIFHQCVWHALEDAGYDPFSYPGRIGLYAGAAANLNWEGRTIFFGTGSSFRSMLLRNRDFMCTHISYKLNLRGPSYSVQTACSTSLAAVHLAVQGLLAGECEIALAGGVTVSCPQKGGYNYQEGMIYSPDGHCRAFDVNSKGVVGGDGAGAVVLKRNPAAASDRDHIYAIIKGTAVNNDGIRKVGYTAPSVQGQVEVIRAAQTAALVEPGSITYIEAHGTGTGLGDPVEIEALKMAFNTGTSTGKKNFCAIGSVKTNIGHLDAAAGAASFIKVVLALQHHQIPPNLHFNKPNPKLGLEDSPFYVVSELIPWKRSGFPLRAGISSLGIGGTNAHVVLEEGPGDNRQYSPQQDRPYRLLLLSAKTPPALEKITANLVNHFKENPGIDPADVAYTLQVGRTPLPYRRMTLCTSVEDAAHNLSQKSGKTRTFFSKAKKPPIIFIFPGQGSQYVNMGRGLYEKEPLFREEIHRCFEMVKPILGYDIEEILYPGDLVTGGMSPFPTQPGNSPLDRRAPQEGGMSRSAAGRQQPDNQTQITQTLLFIFEYALAKLLMKWGIQPQAMMGYSLGEYTAACISGVFSLEDALKTVVSRGALIETTPAGAMSGVPLTEKEIKPLLDNHKDISLAIVNGPSCIVAGTAAAVEAFEKEMKQKRLLCTRINISHAVHSLLMRPIREKFKEKVKEVTLDKPHIPFISNISGDWLTGARARDPGYWAEQMYAPVRFSQGLDNLCQEDQAVFIEIGPGRVLSNIIRQCAQSKPGHRMVSLVRHQQEKEPDDYFLLRAMGQLWLYGIDIHWPGFYSGEARHRLALPTYPFEGRRYWIEAPAFPPTFGTTSSSHGNQPPVQGFEAILPGETTSPASPEQILEDMEIPGEIPGDDWSDYAAPRDELEQKITGLWQEFLGFETIGIHDNFFYLNGDSLTATQLVARVKDLYRVEIPMQVFFEEPTIAHLAQIIKKLLVEKIKNLSPEEKKRLLSTR